MSIKGERRLIDSTTKARPPERDADIWRTRETEAAHALERLMDESPIDWTGLIGADPIVSYLTPLLARLTSALATAAMANHLHHAYETVLPFGRCDDEICTRVRPLLVLWGWPGSDRSSQPAVVEDTEARG